MRGDSAEALQAVAERLAQRLELTLEVPPVPHPGAVERLAHLFGARRAHGAPCLVEAEAGRLKWQPAMLEQPPDVRLRFPHQLLILNVQHPARQHRVPVVHEREIAAVKASEGGELVAESLPLGEVLLERAEARVHRMTSRIDDGGARQDG